MYHRWINIGIVLLLMASFIPVRLSSIAATPDSSQSWQAVGQIGGPTQSAALQGNFAYVGIGMRLEVLDVSNPVTPTQVGATAPFPYFVEDVVVSETLAFVAAGGAGLRVVDVSDPANPTEIGAWDSMGYSEGVAVSDGIVYLADGPYGLRVVDVSDPAHPAEIGYVYEINYAFDAAVSGGYIYVASAGAGLLVASIADPAHPIETASLDTPGYAYGITITGTVAIVADGWEGIDLIDISDPASPQQITSFITPGWAFDVTAGGSTVYVAAANHGLQIVDITNPEQPVLAGGYALPDGHAGSVAAAGNLALIADHNQGLRVMSVADPANPTLLGMYEPMGYAEAVDYAGGFVYVAAGYYGLRVVDVSQPGTPVEAATRDLEGFANSVVLNGQYAYVCTLMTAGYLYIYDITDPAQPSYLGQYPVHIACRDLAVQGTTVYIPDEWGLEIVDVSNPTSPAQLGYIYLCDYTNCGGVTGVEVSGDYAYVANQYLGLMIVDVSDPTNPVHVGTFVTPTSYTLDVRVIGNLAYVADGPVLRILNIADPANPLEVGSVDVVSAFDLVIFGTTAYLAAGNEGVVAVDVADPANPQIIGSYNTPGFTQGIDFDGQYVYAGDGTNGLYIVAPGLAGSGLIQAQANPYTPNLAGLSAVPHPVHTTEPTRPFWMPHPPVTLENIPQPDNAVFRVAATCTVASAADQGDGTLRQCLENAANGDTITFDPAIFPPASPVTVTLESGLPALAQGNIHVDASNAGVILDGNGTPGGTSGLVILSDGNVIQGLQIVGFPGDGIQILEGAENNQVGGDRSLGSGPLGQGNRLSRNTYSGVFIYGTGANGNRVVGNWLGVDVSGTGLDENGWCVSVGGSAQDNVIGGSQEAERNLIGGWQGVNIYGVGTDENRVQGNLIGTQLSGEQAFRASPSENGNPYGVLVNAGAQKNTIGPGNVINGYAWAIGLVDPGTEYNQVAGNLIGTNAAGTAALGNFYSGFDIGGSAENNQIGGTLPVERNIVSGNWRTGIGLGSDHNIVIGNYVGTNISGTAAIANGEDGIWVGSAYNQIGGLEAGQGNLISGNLAGGMNIIHQAAHDNWIAGNYIGVDATGSYSIGNVRHGIALQINANRNTIQGNLVSGNLASGILFSDWGTNYNTITGNRVGTDASGTQAIPNQEQGIAGGFGGASYNRVGGTEPGQGNLASGNEGCGIIVGGSDTPGNLVLGNLVGTDTSGVHGLANVGCGIGLVGNSRVIAGGATPAERNVISSNSPNGNVGGMGVGGDHHVVMGNFIGVDINGSPLPNNGDGIAVVRGGGSIIQGNIIAHNTRFGVYIESSAGITLRRNIIFDHGEGGIRLYEGNNQLPAPVITTITPFGISGTACPGCTIEVFSDAGDEGQIYEGSITADISGAFTFNKGISLAGPYVTATATDSNGNTSEFSTAWIALKKLFLPIIMNELYIQPLGEDESLKRELRR